MVLCDQWFFDIIVIVLGCHEPHPYKMANLNDKLHVFKTAPLTSHSPISLPLLAPPLQNTTILELG